MRSVIYGKIGRVYEANEIARYIAIICIACAAGYGLGPVVNICFRNVILDFGEWHLDYTNMPGVYMAIILCINQIFLFFMVHDLSLEKECIDEPPEPENSNKSECFDSEECLKSMDLIETNEKSAESKCPDESLPLIDNLLDEDLQEKSKTIEGDYSVPS